MTFLVADTETTGFGSDAKIVQIAMQLYDDNNKVVGEFSSLIYHPDLTIIPNQEFHNDSGNGISIENCKKYGQHMLNGLDIFTNWVNRADTVVGHNLSFDLRMLTQQFRLSGISTPILGNPYCTMKNSKQLVKTPPTAKMAASGRTGYKNPKLTELYMFLFGEEMPNAHDAMGDVRATAKCYIELKKRGL